MRIILISLLLVFTSSMSIYSQSRKIENLKTDYLQSALLEFNNKKLPVNKWENKDTLKYHITGEFQFMSEKKWEKYLGNIENLIGIKIIETENFDDSDIEIFFGELDEYFIKNNIKAPGKINLDEFDNWNNRSYNNKKQLTKTSFCIVPSRTKDSKRGNFNLKKLFLRSLGLLGELKSEYSVFYKYQTQYNSHLSKNDKKIIKIHYDESIKAGMKLEEIELALNKVDMPAILKERY